MTIDPMTRALEARNRAVAEERATIDTALERGDGFSADERAKLAKLEEAIADYDKTLRTLKDRAQNDREADEARAQYESFVRPDTVERAFSDKPEGNDKLMALLRGEIKGADFDTRAVAREKLAIRQGLRGAEFRDLVVGTAALGGNIVPTSFERALYDFLEVFSGVRRLNVTVLTTASGENLDVPKVTLHGTAAIVGEGTALAENDPQFGKTTLQAWKYGQLVQMSNELLTDSGVDVVSFVARDCARAIARATDSHYATGNGSNQPLGFMTAMGTGVTGANGGTGVPSFDNLIDLVYSVNSAYRANGAQFAMRDATAGYVRKLKDTTNQYLWQPSTQIGQPDRLLSFPVVEVPAIAAMGTGIKSIGFGDFAGYYVRDVGSVRLERSDEFAFSSDLVTWRCIFRTDGDLVDLSGAVQAFRGGTA
jgi:HK97 family phage major capsid protein